MTDVFRALKIGPYEHLRQRRWSLVLRENWQWLVGAGLGLAWILISLARMKYLVRLRTSQLDDAYQQTRRERKKMEHAACLSLIGEMASSLAHEISQPLASIANYACGCLRCIEGGRPTEDVEPGAKQIVVRVERAAIILRRMRDFVRKRSTVLTEVDIGEILMGTLDFLCLLQNSRGVTLEYRAGDALPATHADRTQIEEVLLNPL